MNILLADDNVTLRDLMEEFLLMLDHHVVTAEDGQSALKQFQSHRIDMVITDIIMPGINGIDLIRKIRAQDQSVPVVIISGFAQPASIDEARKLDAIVYEKPVDFTMLKLVIDSTRRKIRE